MRILPIGAGLAAAVLAASSAHAQFISHQLVPGTDIIVAPSTPQPGDQRVATPPPVPIGVQSGVAGNAGGSNDFPRHRSAATGSNAPVSAKAQDYPLSWKGSAQDWTMHSQACAARYPGYDPQTDTFEQRPGVRAVCPQMFGRNR